MVSTKGDLVHNLNCRHLVVENNETPGPKHAVVAPLVFLGVWYDHNSSKLESPYQLVASLAYRTQRGSPQILSFDAKMTSTDTDT